MFKDFKYLIGIVLAICFMAWITPANAEVEKPPEATLQELKDTKILHIGPCVWKEIERGCVIGRDQVNGTFYVYILDANRNITHVVRIRNGVETILWVRKDQFI